ncbi:hypothetical protein AZE42_12969 [Rhizopogon vesiculosus]|uniref:DDE Tnp4 domain-containing protein n=1 Tax=Rhizopogon vesiculosus TaxID=180088 RepID=A0A1J8QP47_9AGAM|nr:hypothetical protein AZE42_12969 [Rhizopogon vesiculosus]
MSVHDVWAFQSTHIYEEHATLLQDDHWIWADSAYPLEPWCIPPFKKPCNGRLSQNQKTFNYHLSKVHVCVEHVFAALKGQFQSLRELRHNIRTEEDLQYTGRWIQCCIILHNMIIRFEANHNQDSQLWAHQEGSVHVRVEHVFAALKGRFQSLQELQHNIWTEEDLQYTGHWIQCCIILHNMIIWFEANHN